MSKVTFYMQEEFVLVFALMLKICLHSITHNKKWSNIGIPSEDPSCVHLFIYLDSLLGVTE